MLNSVDEVLKSLTDYNGYKETELEGFELVFINSFNVHGTEACEILDALKDSDYLFFDGIKNAYVQPCFLDTSFVTRMVESMFSVDILKAHVFETAIGNNMHHLSIFRGDKTKISGDSLRWLIRITPRFSAIYHKGYFQ